MATSATSRSSSSHLVSTTRHDGVLQRQPKKILIVVTAGGYTNAAPVLEIARILASRGYTVDFATLSGGEQWVKDRPYISEFHIIGPSVPAAVEEASYMRMSSWPADIMSNWGAIFDTRIFLESSWPDAYRGLSKLVGNPVTRPDFILADYLVDAARDVSYEHGIPLAMHWPQMPTAMLPAPYIPGTLGLQIEVLTSEFATLWQRLRNAVAIYTSLPHYLRYLRWRKKMRLSAGVTRVLPTLTKPDYLCLVNSFFGLEPAKDVPPNVAAIGPILDDSITPLDTTYDGFLSTRRRVLYVSLGTHVLLAGSVMNQLLMGVLGAFHSGAIDGVIWAIRAMARKQLDHTAEILVPGFHEQHGKLGASMTVAALLGNAHPSVLFVNHAPQKSLLHDSRIVTFVTHAGASSSNEALYAGVPLVTVAVYFDQLQNAMRLRDAGVSVPLDKDRLTARQVQDAIEHIATDRSRQGPVATNVERMQRIAQVAAKRKHLGADLMEEVLADWEGRRRERECGGDGCRPRGMHLQTADGRMPVWKARNWDLRAVGLAATFCLLGMVVVLPVALVKL